MDDLEALQEAAIKAREEAFSEPESNNEEVVDEVPEQEEEIKDEEINEDNDREIDNDTGDTSGDSDDDPIVESSDDNTPVEDSFEPIVVKVNGANITLDTREEVERYLNNVSTDDKYVEPVEAQVVKQAGLTDEDIALLYDIKKGNVDAAKVLLEKNKLDLLDIEDASGQYESSFKPTIKTEMDAIVSRIESKPELKSKIVEAMDMMSPEFEQLVTSNPKDFEVFTNQVESGLAKEALAYAIKEEKINGRNMADAYVHFVNNAKPVNSNSSSSSSSKPTQRRQVSEAERNLRERAKDNGRQGDNAKPSSVSADDIWNMSAEEIMNLSADQLRA